MVISLMATEHSETTADQSEAREADHSQPGLAVQTLGEFPQDLPESCEGVVLKFLPSSLPLKKRWRVNGLSADFLATYLTTFLPAAADQPEMLAKRREIESAVSYIANELLENAMKFSDSTSAQPISITLYLYSKHLYLDQLVFLVTNSIDATGVQQYRMFIQEVSTAEVSAILLRRLEQSAENQECQSSGLGLVTILHDYLAKLGWKFESSPDDSQALIVTTAVQLSI